MRGYQKLKRENQLLWFQLRLWIMESLKTRTPPAILEETIDKEMAWVKAKIEDETK